MVIKQSLGRLKLTRVIDALFIREFEEQGFELIYPAPNHLWQLDHLPWHHRDPFDRMLAAQCLEENLTIISRDEIFDAYGVKRVW